MPPLSATLFGPAAFGDAEVLASVAAHVERYEPAARKPRHRRTAARAAEATLDWWRRRGGVFGASGDTAAAIADAERAVGSALGGLALLVLPWVARLVVRLLVAWLLSSASAAYRAAVSGGRG